MAQIIVTSTADSGSGSLRQAIADAQSGDTIVFDNTGENPPFPDGVETSIYLESSLTLPAKTLTIDGGETWTDNGVLKTRVVLDGQNARRVALNSQFSASRNTFNAIAFKNGYTNGGNGAGYSVSNTSTSSFNNCVFSGNAAASGGGVSIATTGNASFNNCVFSDNTATNGAAIYSNSTNAQTISGGAFTTTSSSSVYLNSTGVVAFTNSPKIDKLTLANNSAAAISDNLTADVLTINNGATVTFSGVDAVLAVTTTATIGSATFTAAADSTGYAAFPAGTDVSQATFTGVSVATYSATAATVSATVVEREATITTNVDVATSVVEAIFDDSTLSPLSVIAGKAAISKDRAFKVRLFNGSFYESSWIPRTYYYKGSASSGSFATASDWAMDSGKTLTCNAAPTIANSTFDCR